MARARAVLPDGDALRAMIDEESRVAVRVTPGARVETLEIVEGKLCAKVRAQPENGKANIAVARLLAEALGIASGKVELLRGATSREKQFSVSL